MSEGSKQIRLGSYQIEVCGRKVGVRYFCTLSSLCFNRKGPAADAKYLCVMRHHVEVASTSPLYVDIIASVALCGAAVLGGKWKSRIQSVFVIYRTACYRN